MSGPLESPRTRILLRIVMQFAPSSLEAILAAPTLARAPLQRSTYGETLIANGARRERFPALARYFHRHQLQNCLSGGRTPCET